MWLSFQNTKAWKPMALKVAVGMVNAVSGEPWSQALGEGGQDYLVCPPQPWLDGIKSGDGVIRQFVAMPLGMGYTVEGQLTGEERFGGVQLVAFDAKPGLFSEPPLPTVGSILGDADFAGVADGAALAPLSARAFGTKAMLGSRRQGMAAAGAEMGLGAGGRMEEKVYPDPHGPQTWDAERYGRVYVHIVNSLLFEEITGRRPPASPVSTQTYSEHGYPWFQLYDEQLGDLETSELLEGVQSVKELDAAHEFAPQQDDSTVEVPDGNVIGYPLAKPASKTVIDGDWPK